MSRRQCITFAHIACNRHAASVSSQAIRARRRRCAGQRTGSGCGFSRMSAAQRHVDERHHGRHQVAAATGELSARSTEKLNFRPCSGASRRSRRRLPVLKPATPPPRGTRESFCHPEIVAGPAGRQQGARSGGVDGKAGDRVLRRQVERDRSESASGFDVESPDRAPIATEQVQDWRASPSNA
jgi:hypothetical protein